MKTQAVLFDMDGVILDSEPLHNVARDRLFVKLGVDPVEAASKIVVGARKLEYWAMLKEQYGLEGTPEELAAREFDGILEAIIEYKRPESPNLSELLHFLKDNGIKTAVGSASTRNYVEKVVEYLGIKQYFDAFVCGDEVKRPKPYPDTYLIAAQKLGADPAHCFVVEDSRTGSLAAQAAGIPCIGYRGTETSLGADMSACTHIVTDMHDIIALIK